MTTRSPKRDLDHIVETVLYLMTEGRRLSKGEAVRLGVTPTQVTVLKMLHQIGDLSLGRLSREIGAHNSTVTGIIDRMEAAGLVTRERSDEDRRVWMIRLTPAGRKVATRAQVGPWDTLRDAVHALPSDEQEQLTALLHKVAAHVAARIEPAREGRTESIKEAKGEQNGTRR